MFSSQSFVAFPQVRSQPYSNAHRVSVRDELGSNKFPVCRLRLFASSVITLWVASYDYMCLEAQLEPWYTSPADRRPIIFKACAMFRELYLRRRTNFGVDLPPLIGTPGLPNPHLWLHAVNRG